MALSGSVSTNSYEGRYLRLSWTATQDVATNKSTIKWTLYSEGGSSLYYSTGPTTVKIAGETVYYKNRVNWDTYAFPAAKGSTSGTLTLEHDGDGKKSFSVSISTAIVSFSINCTGSQTFTLDPIQRYQCVYVSNGTEWKKGKLYVRDGGQWIQPPLGTGKLYVSDGIEWKENIAKG